MSFIPPRIAAPYLGQVATNSGVMNNLSGTGTQYMNSRSCHKATQSLSTATQLQIGVANWSVNAAGATPGNEQGPAGVTTITAAIEYPSGTIAGVVHWSGSTNTTFGSPFTHLSDPVVLSGTIPTGTFFFVRIYATNPNGLCYCNQGGNPGLGECMQFSGTSVPDLTQAPGSFTTTYPGNNSNIVRPVLIVGQTTAASVYILGDSRSVGISDTPDASGDLGEIGRSLGAAGLAYINGGVAGDHVLNFLTNSTQRQNLMRYASHVILQMGINDLSFNGGSTGDTQLRGNVLACRALIQRTVPVFLVTMPPETSSTDNWASLAAQSDEYGDGATRASHNAWRIGVPPGFAGCFDICPSVETGTGTNRWVTNGTAKYFTTDGVHETRAANLAIAASGAITTSLIVR